MVWFQFWRESCHDEGEEIGERWGANELKLEIAVERGAASVALILAVAPPPDQSAFRRTSTANPPPKRRQVKRWKLGRIPDAPNAMALCGRRKATPTSRRRFKLRTDALDTAERLTCVISCGGRPGGAGRPVSTRAPYKVDECSGDHWGPRLKSDIRLVTTLSPDQIDAVIALSAGRIHLRRGPITKAECLVLPRPT